MPTPHRVLILGGGFAGLECARRLGKDPRFEVTLIDRTNHHLFQPLLYQVATASLAAPDIARSIRQILSRHKQVTVFLDEIKTIDTEARTATGLSGRSYPYDSLVVAVGARTSFFGNDHWESHTLGLKTLADAQSIRRLVLQNLELAERSDDPAERERLMSVAIIGGGPTGVELAGAFADLIHRALYSDFRRIDTRKLRVILIEGSAEILEPYDPPQRQYAANRLTKLGVEVRTQTRVADISPGRLSFTDGSTLEAGAIIWAAGVAAHPLTAALGVPVDRAGRVTPNPDLSLPGHPNVFVAGDIVSLVDARGKRVPGVAPAALQMGAHIARILKADPAAPRPPFRYLDKGLMAIIGKNAAVVKSGKVRLQGWLAWLAWLFIHIAFLIGFRNKLVVLAGWAAAYLRDEPDARVIIGGRDR